MDDGESCFDVTKDNKICTMLKKRESEGESPESNPMAYKLICSTNLFKKKM